MTNPIANAAPLGSRHSISHDGFTGTVIGHYERLDGKRGVVLQQDGTKVVHVYGERWIGAAATPSDTAEAMGVPLGEVDAIHAYAQDYEFRCDDGGGYTPTEAERAMIEDAITGFVSENARTAPEAQEASR